jgi:hypothetical protein
MNHRELKRANAYLRAENAKQDAALREIPRAEWPTHALRTGQQRVFRSKEFLVQIFAEKNGAIRMSVSRTHLMDNGRWDDGISWDELQRLKREAGFGSSWAVEIYPADSEVVNVANMRHLWLLPRAPQFAWREESTESVAA